MTGKIILCFAVVLVGQALSSTVFDGEEFKKVGEQIGQSAVSVANHFSQLLGFPPSNVDIPKNFEKLKSLTVKGLTDLETEVGKLREIVRKNVDPKYFEKFDELEKDFKKQATEAKILFEDKVGKPINDKYKDDVKKVSEAVLKSTKDIEASINKAIDGVKKP